MNFPDARVLVTGAASGLGEALAARFQAAGARVLSTDLQADEERGIAALDVTSDADWAAAAEQVRREWGGLDVLVNNAGVAGGGRVDRCTIDEWRGVTRNKPHGAGGGPVPFSRLFQEQGRGGFRHVPP